MTNSNPTDDAGQSDALIHGLRKARVNLALKERVQHIAAQLGRDWEAWRNDVIDGKATGLSPVAKLKLEALASIAALSDFHCSAAHQLIDEGMHEDAHSWTLDEGTLNAAFDLISSVNTTDI